MGAPELWFNIPTSDVPLQISGEVRDTRFLTRTLERQETVLFMKTIIALALLMSSTQTAFAITRIASTSVTCETAKALLQDRKALIFRFPSKAVIGLTLYDRYVSDAGQCESQTYSVKKFIPTKNTDRCPVLACEIRTNRGRN